MSNILLLADHQLAGTQRLVNAFAPQPVDILLCGASEDLAQQMAIIAGVRQVLLAQDDAFAGRVAEHEAATAHVLAHKYQCIAAPASTSGKNLLPRLAALLRVQPITDVIKIVDNHTFVRPIYAGALQQTVSTAQSLLCLTVRTAAFAPAAAQQAAPVVFVPAVLCKTPVARVLKSAVPAAGRPDLTNARVVVSGGRGFGSAEQFRHIEPLADALGAAIGATRAAVDAGYIGNAHQVGQTGKIVSPALYIAIGLSGAVQHKAGMKDSGTVVAINTDAQAPIMQDADFAWQSDLFTAIPQLLQLLNHIKKDATS